MATNNLATLGMVQNIINGTTPPANAENASKVSNALTIIANEQSTIFDGSQAKTVDTTRYLHNVTITIGQIIIKLAPIISNVSSYSSLSDIYNALASTKYFPNNVSYIGTSIISCVSGGTTISANLLLFTNQTTAEVYREEYDSNVKLYDVDSTATIADLVTPF